MTKKEFLNILYEQLSDQMPEAKASAHTQYYHDYIQDAIKRGQKEKQVLDSLGDPRLIAKTLIDTDAEPSVFSGTNTSDYSGQDIYHTETQVMEISRTVNTASPNTGTTIWIFPPGTES